MPLRDDDMRPRPVKHLAGLSAFLHKSDFVVANMESPLLHNPDLSVVQTARFRFASPCFLAEQARDAGITHLSVCNNHCLDQGFPGLMETIDCIREAGVVPVGVRKDLNEPPYAVLEKEGIRVALFASTYGTNWSENRIRLTRRQSRHINMTQEQELSNPFSRLLWARFRSIYWLTVRFSENWEAVYPCERTEFTWLKLWDIRRKISRMIKEEKPDVVVMYPHDGGQHRPDPMKKAQRLIKWLFRRGADAVICNHEHLVQRAEMQQGKMAAFCLGNVVSYLGLYDHIDQYKENLSIMLHQYITREHDGKISLRYTFSVAKTFLNSGGNAETRPMHELIAEAGTPEERAELVEELQFIGSRFAGKPWTTCAPEQEEHPFPA